MCEGITNTFYFIKTYHYLNTKLDFSKTSSFSNKNIFVFVFLTFFEYPGESNFSNISRDVIYIS